MLNSLSGKIYAVGVVMILALAALASLLMLSSSEMESGYRWVQHTQRVLELTSRPVDLVRRAESELRASIISDDPSFSLDTPALLHNASMDLDELVRITSDNSSQNDRAQKLREAVRKRVGFMQFGLSQLRAGKYAQLSKADMQERSRQAEALMAQVENSKNEMLQAERALLNARTSRAESLFRYNRRSVAFGVPLIILLIVGSKIYMVRAIRRPTAEMLNTMNAFGRGDLSARMHDHKIGAAEFSSIANGYNQMAERLGAAMEQQRVSEDHLYLANLALEERSSALETRSAVVERVDAMSLRLLASRSDAEFAKVIECFVPQVLIGSTGGVYAHSNSRNQLVRIAKWGDADDLPEWFEPHACWGLRLVRTHVVESQGTDLTCSHVPMGSKSHCEPLLAGGEVIGMIHLADILPAAERFRMTMLSREVGSALVNHMLQRDLREQTIRDPLTSLFNRRYLDETLTMELARAARGGAPMALIMCDVDHFKRFNDEHGHDAGDAVLRSVAAEMQKHFRDGDVVCRYGGEEFTIIAPGASAEAIAARVEGLRAAITTLKVRTGSVELPSVSMSFGIAGYTPAITRGADLIELADEALYRAKRQGRNRAVVAERLAA